MTVQFHVLASGSAGNACVLDVGGFGVLIDFGLPPRLLTPRMKQCGIDWDCIHAALLSHTHSDHYQSATLAHFAKLRLPVYCHEEHRTAFNQESRAFMALSAAGLIRHYEPGESLPLHADCQCVPIEVDHDSAKTCGFRLQGRDWAIGYAADLGCWRPALARHFADVDLLALEFNHDVPMQLHSGRSPLLIRRVLGNSGHLSNEQGAACFAEIMRLSETDRVRHLVQLHLSRDCNRPELAATAALNVLNRLGVEMSIHTTDQEQAGPSITLGTETKPHRRRWRIATAPRFVQPMLPFEAPG